MKTTAGMAYGNGVVSFSIICKEFGVTRQRVCETCKIAVDVFIMTLKKINPDLYSHFRWRGMSDEEIICFMLSHQNENVSDSGGGLSIEDKILLILEIRGKKSHKKLYKKWFLPIGIEPSEVYGALERLERNGQIENTSDHGPSMYKIKKNRNKKK